MKLSGKVFSLLVINIILLTACGNRFQRFTSQSGRFSILVPGTPQEIVRQVDQIEIHSFMTEDKKGNSYYLYYFQYPEGEFKNSDRITPVQAFLHTVFLNAIESSKDNRIVEVAQNGDYEGVRFKSTCTNPCEGMAYLFGDRIYVVYVSYMADMLSEEGVKQYVSSFRYEP